MVPVARRNLLAEPTRLLISVGGVALAVLIILVILSLYQGFRQALGSFVAKVPADVWVVQFGATDLFHSTSVLPAELEQRLARIEGVSGVAPVLARRVSAVTGVERAGLFLFATDEAVLAASGVALVEGKAVPGPGEVLVDAVFAKKYGFRRGDQLTVGPQRLSVAGIFRGGNASAAQFALITPSDAMAIFGKPGLVNYFLVKANPGQSPATVAQAVRQAVPEAAAYTKEEFTENNRREVTEIFLPIVAVLVLIAFVVGTAVIGLTIYTATLERTREFGLLKAIGAAPGFLYRIILTQSLILALLGFAAGIVATLGVNALANQVVPEFVTVLRWADALWVLAAAVAMSLLAAYLPMRRVAALDPALVFRA